MAINQNHLFEDLNGVKCAIVEKNASEERVSFLKSLLELNGYQVIVTETVQKTPPPAATPTADSPPVEAPAAPKTFTIGVTDVTFNPTNAIFGRLLKTNEGRVVTLAYWQGKEKVADDTKPYFD